MTLVTILFLLVFFTSWAIGWVLADPTNHLLDALKIRETLQQKLDAVPGSETFTARLLECRVCVGSYPGLALSTISGLLIAATNTTTALEAALLVPVLWLGSVLTHYLTNLLSALLKSRNP